MYVREREEREKSFQRFGDDLLDYISIKTTFYLLSLPPGKGEKS